MEALYKMKIYWHCESFLINCVGPEWRSKELRLLQIHFSSSVWRKNMDHSCSNTNMTKSKHSKIKFFSCNTDKQKSHIDFALVNQGLLSMKLRTRDFRYDTVKYGASLTRHRFKPFFTETAKWASRKPKSNINQILETDVYENFTGVLERL